SPPSSRGGGAPPRYDIRPRIGDLLLRLLHRRVQFHAYVPERVRRQPARVSRAAQERRQRSRITRAREHRRKRRRCFTVPPACSCPFFWPPPRRFRRVRAASRPSTGSSAAYRSVPPFTEISTKTGARTSRIRQAVALS